MKKQLRYLVCGLGILILSGCMIAVPKYIESQTSMHLKRKDDSSKLRLYAKSKIAIVLTQNTKSFVQYAQKERDSFPTDAIGGGLSAKVREAMDPKDLAIEFLAIIKRHFRGEMSLQPDIETARSKADLILLIDRWESYEDIKMGFVDLKTKASIYFVLPEDSLIIGSVTGMAQTRVEFSNFKHHTQEAEGIRKTRTEALSRLVSQMQSLLGQPLDYVSDITLQH